MTVHRCHPVRARPQAPDSRPPALGLADQQNPHYSSYQGAMTRARGLLDKQEHNRNTLANSQRESKIPKVTK
jgi:hypothetical protein